VQIGYFVVEGGEVWIGGSGCHGSSRSQLGAGFVEGSIVSQTVALEGALAADCWCIQRAVVLR